MSTNLNQWHEISADESISACLTCMQCDERCPAEVGYTDLVAAGIDLNALAVCGVNEAIGGGENSGGYPYIVKVS